MWKRGKDSAAATPEPVELCDYCGLVFPAMDAATGYVPDSSCADLAHPWFDGLRRVVACCAEDLENLRAEYRLRPFVQEELWAAKLDCAFRTGRRVRSVEELSCCTGLDHEEIRAAVAWRNENRAE